MGNGQSSSRREEQSDAPVDDLRREFSSAHALNLKINVFPRIFIRMERRGLSIRLA